MKATKVDSDLCIGQGLCCGSATRFSANEQERRKRINQQTLENQGAVQEAIGPCPSVCNRLKINSNTSICFFD